MRWSPLIPCAQKKGKKLKRGKTQRLRRSGQSTTHLCNLIILPLYLPFCCSSVRVGALSIRCKGSAAPAFAHIVCLKRFTASTQSSRVLCANTLFFAAEHAFEEWKVHTVCSRLVGVRETRALIVFFGLLAA